MDGGLWRVLGAISFRAFKYSRVLGDPPSEWKILLMILEDTSEKAIVAGAKAGAGADDVVLVRETAERDLSRNPTTDYRQKKMSR
jgi:hypothetical protein